MTDIFKRPIITVFAVLITSIFCPAIAGPPGDDCAQPVIITESAVYTGNSTGATGSSVSSCSYNDTKDVWHSFTPSQDGNYTISLCGSSFDTTLSVYDRYGGTELSCNDDICGIQSQVVVNLISGQEYLIRVAGYDGDSGEYLLVASKRDDPPVNDEITGAIEVFEDLPFQGTSLGATGQDYCSCAEGYDFYDVWHTFTPAATANYSISLCNSTFDTTLSIRDSQGSEIACNDDSCGSQSKLDINLTGGQTYNIRIAGYDGATGDYILDVTRYLGPPVNDQCANALELSLDTPYYGTTNGATGTSTSGCSNNDKLDVWHKFTPSNSGYHTISLCGSSFDTTLSVYTGCSGSSIACNDNMCDVQSEVVVDLTAGQTYLIRIAGKGGKTGDYVIVASERLTQPQNDDCADAIEVFEGVQYSGSNVGALGDTGSSCGYGFDFYDVWHKFTPATTKDYLLSLCGSDFDTILSLYDSCGGIELACNDDSCSSQSALTAQLTAGVTYLLRISGYDGDLGNYTLNISESTPPPSNDDCANAIPLELDLPYTGSTVNATGTNTSSCSEDDYYDVWFSFTPSITESYIIDLCESQFDTTLSVYDSCTGTELACDDDACGSQSKLTMSLQAGNTYLLRVAGYRGAIGTYTIAVKCNCTLVDMPGTPYPDDKAYNIQRDVTLAWNSGKSTLENLASTGIYLKGIYGTDDRLDEYQVTNPSLKAIGDSTVALVSVGDMTDNGNGTYSVPTQTLAEYYLDLYGRPLCPDEPFINQPTASLCTGFLVAPDLVITTGHCIETQSTCTDRAFIFGFKMLNSTTAVTTFDSSDVYYCKGIVARTQTEESDWALVRLDREVVNHAPIDVRRTGVIPDDQNVTVIGHTLGLPVKYASNAWVQQNSDTNNFQVNLDTYMGNSGSPVVNMDTYQIEGILFSGNPDFVEDGDCDRSAVYPDSGAPDWERVTRSTEFSGLIPVFDVYLGTDPSNMQLIASDIARPWCTADDLDCGKNYYWQVVTKTAGVTAYGEIWVFSTELAGDFDHDCDVDIEDFSNLANKWLYQSCGITNDYCQGSDIDKLGSVTIEDLIIFVENWTSEIAD